MDLALAHIVDGLTGSVFVVDTAFLVLAEYLPYVLVLTGVIALWRLPHWRQRAFAFLFTALAVVVSRGLIAGVLKELIARPRPFEVLSIQPLFEVGGFSFPSGHATFFLAFAVSVWLFKRSWGWWLIGGALLNGIARVVGGVHWTTDILASIVIAVVSVGIVYVLLQPAFRKLFVSSNQLNQNQNILDDDEPIPFEENLLTDDTISEDTEETG